MEFTDEEHMLVHIPESVLAEERGEELLDILEKIFCERCGLKLVADLQYEPQQTNKYKEDSDKRMEMEIQRIVANSSFHTSAEREDGSLMMLDDEPAKDEQPRQAEKKQSAQ